MHFAVHNCVDVERGLSLIKCDYFIDGVEIGDGSCGIWGSQSGAVDYIRLEKLIGHIHGQRSASYVAGIMQTFQSQFDVGVRCIDINHPVLYINNIYLMIILRILHFVWVCGVLVDT